MTQIKKILSYLQKAIDSLFNNMIQSRQKQVEAYLARSTDLVDLERRMKEVQKDGIRRPGF